jgi:hypothetical protein
MVGTTRPRLSVLTERSRKHRGPRSAVQTLQPRLRMHLVEQSAIDRCLWTKEKDVALGDTKRLRTDRRCRTLIRIISVNLTLQKASPRQRRKIPHSTVDKLHLARFDTGRGVGRVVSGGYARRLDHYYHDYYGYPYYWTGPYLWGPMSCPKIPVLDQKGLKNGAHTKFQLACKVD